MIQKIILAIMVVLLGINLYSWNVLTNNNEKEIKRIHQILEECKNK